MALLSALLCGLASPTFVGCKDYDDDIKDLQEQIDGNKSAATTELSKAISEQITALENKLNTAIADKADKSVISGIQNDINTLKGLESRINKLESDAANYLKAGALDGYLKEGALDGYLKEGALDGLLNEDALAQYLKNNSYLTSADVDGIPTEEIIRTWLDTELTELQDLIDLFNEKTRDDLAKLPELISDVATMKSSLEELLKENGRLAQLEAKVAAFQSTISSIGAALVISPLNFIKSEPLEKDITWGYNSIKVDLTKGDVLNTGSQEFPVIINPSDVKFDKYNYSLVDARGEEMPFELGIEKNWTLSEGENPFAARSAEKEINKDLYTVKASYVEDKENPFKGGVLALKATSKDEDKSVSVISKYEFMAKVSAPMTLEKIGVDLESMYLGKEVDVNDIAVFTFNKEEYDFEEAGSFLYKGIGYVMIDEKDAFTKTCLENGNIDQDLLYKGIIKVSEKAENVPFELDEATLKFKYYAMDWNGNLKSVDISVEFHTQMYSNDVQFADQKITIMKENGNTLEKEVKFDDILKAVMTAKQLELWKTHAKDLEGTVTDAEGKEIDGAKVIITDKTSFNVSATSAVKPGDYTITIKFTDDRTDEEGLFVITGKLTVDALTITPNLAEGYWTDNVLTIPGVYTDATTKYVLKANMKNAFIIETPEGIDPTLEFALVREDITAEYITISGNEITWNKNLANENLIGKELEFTVKVKNGNVVLSEQTYKLKFINPLSGNVVQNKVKHTLENDRNSASTSTFDLNKLLSFADVQKEANELFGLSGKGTEKEPYASTGDFTELAKAVYELDKANIKFEIEGTNKTNLTLGENGIVTWTNVTGAEFNGVTVNFNVTITHKYGTSTGKISVKIEEKK